LPDAVLTDSALGDFAQAAALGSFLQAELDAHAARLLGLTPADAEALAAVARRADPRR